MSPSIYIIKASKTWGYECLSSSIVLTTLDIDEAIQFAADYHKNNLALVQEVQGYDHFCVTVFSSVIGQPNTEAMVWYSYESRGVHSHYEDNEKNISFAYDLEASLIEKFKKNVNVNLKSNTTMKPTIGWSLGKAGLLISEQDHTMEIVQYAVDQYSEHLSNIKSKTIIEMSSSILTNELIHQDAQSKENKELWSLYEKYEQEFYRV